MRTLVCLVMLFGTSAAFAGPADDAKAALAFAKVKREREVAPLCKCGAYCDCKPGEACKDVTCPENKVITQVTATPPCKCGCVETGKCECKNCDTHTADPAFKAKAKFGLMLGYEEGCALAEKSGKPLITYIAYQFPYQFTDEAVFAEVGSLAGYPAKTLLVSVWVDGSHVGRVWPNSLHNLTAPGALDEFVEKIKTDHRAEVVRKATAVTWPPLSTSGVTGGCANGKCGVPAGAFGTPVFGSFGSPCANGKCGR